MEQTNPQEPAQESTPAREGNSIKKIIWIVVAIIIVLLVVLAVIGSRSASQPGELTEKEKQDLMDALNQNPGPELTNEEISTLEAALNEGADKVPELSEQEKQDLMDALNQ